MRFIALLLLTALPSSGEATPPVVVARVNGAPIALDRLTSAMNALMPIASFHRNVSVEKLAEIRSKALQNVIDEELQYQDAVRQRLKVPKEEVSRGIDRLVAHYGSKQAFEKAMKESGAKLDDLRRNIERVLLVKRAYDIAVGLKCAVTDEETAQFYKSNPQRFVTPEQLHLFAITISVAPAAPRADWEKARTKAADLLKQIRSGVSFEDLARKYSTDPSKDKGGDMGFIHRGSMAEEFEKVFAQMRPGDLSDVVESIYGFHLFRLAEIRPAQQKTFDEVKEKLKTDLTSKRCSEMNDAWTRRLRSAARIEVYDVKESPAVPALAKSH
ncbi:MAG: peptidylprolyl isomerase [Acidobacteriota bacterium]